jgi:hypothetical protein
VPAMALSTNIRVCGFIGQLRSGAIRIEANSAHGQPAVNRFRKQLKSSTLRTGGVVELSQLA